MFLITNKSERVYVIGDKNIIPGEPPVEITAVEAKHPMIQLYAKAGHLELVEVGEPEGVKILDDMTSAELKAYAKSQKIDFGEATKKDDILAAIKATEASKVGE